MTRQLPRTEWKAYFDRYTREHLSSSDETGVHEVAIVEVLLPRMGDQFEVTFEPLLGMTYDPKSNAFELLLRDIDHLVFRPAEIAVIEDDDGFISELEIVRADDVKEIVHLRRSGPPAVRHDAPAPPGG
ncbi:MAG TPA: DUF5335 family protein [Polyangia bacterium]|nr:DUF5335 family protein [Polyangia bacterium]